MSQKEVSLSDHASYSFSTNTVENNKNTTMNDAVERDEKSNYKFFTLDGKEATSENAWAYEVETSEETKFYIKVSHGIPKHRQFSLPSGNFEKFKLCSESIFMDYVSYLTDRNENSYKLAKNNFQLEGFSS